ncbi:MAG: DegT/DnrJ/EryC1/StrS family aminotransferase [Candidatus Hydrogenedentota bacterium]
MIVPLVDLIADSNEILQDIEKSVLKVIRSGKYILSEEVNLFEKELAQWNNTKYCIGVSSGTDALLLALLALDIKEGDEVITTPFTFIATVEAILVTGAKPAFVDINSTDLNINPDLIKEKITEKTKAIIPVHLYGCPCDMTSILSIAREYNLYIIEDLAQAIGAEWCDKKVGNFGDINCVSFFPAKNLGCMGDAGAMFTANENYQKKLVALRQHGSLKKYYHQYLGVNARIDEIQAAILRVKLKKIDEWNNKRKEIAKIYRENLKGLPLKFQEPDDKAKCVYNQFTIIVEKRDKLMEYLNKNNIATAIHYPIPLHLQPVLNDLGYKIGDLAVSEELANRVLSLPIYPAMEPDRIEYVCDSIIKFFRS